MTNCRSDKKADGSARNDCGDVQNEDSQEWREANEARAAALEAAEAGTEAGEIPEAGAGTEAGTADTGAGTDDGDSTGVVTAIDPETGEEIQIFLFPQKQREAGTFLTTEQIREAGRILPVERNGFVQAAFSKDGKYVYCVQNVIRKDSKEFGICIDRLDAATGEVLEELYLPMADQKITLWEEEEAFVLVDQKYNEVNTSDLSVYSNGEWAYPSYAGAVRDVGIERRGQIAISFKRKEFSVSPPPGTCVREPHAYETH